MKEKGYTCRARTMKAVPRMRGRWSAPRAHQLFACDDVEDARSVACVALSSMPYYVFKILPTASKTDVIDSLCTLMKNGCDAEPVHRLQPLFEV